jgi:hypothetical protein
MKQFIQHYNKTWLISGGYRTWFPGGGGGADIWVGEFDKKNAKGRKLKIGPASCSFNKNCNWCVYSSFYNWQYTLRIYEYTNVFVNIRVIRNLEKYICNWGGPERGVPSRRPRKFWNMRLKMVLFPWLPSAVMVPFGWFYKTLYFV